MKPVIQLNQVHKRFTDKKVVQNLSFEIEKGSFVALLGPNGAGKTTTISMMLGLINQTSGQILLFGKKPEETAVKNRIGAMLQDVHLIDDLTVEELIDLFRHYYPKSLPLDYLLAVSDLQKSRKKIAHSLSGGQKRRLSFALSLAGDPDLLFLDEPTVGMDIISRQLFWDTVRKLKEQGKTIILTTHYLEEADKMADRIIMIDQGKLIVDGTPTELKKSTLGKSISFIVDQKTTTQKLYQFPGVTDVVWEGERVKLYSQDTDQLIRELINSHLKMKEIEISNSNLEEAFQHYVEKAKIS
ncbi:ABC-2 type transport system ATP-binding protein [Seinonella peptonophila]|uniref:ABC-2 type transport system ATP-binding protein n=1 Tax=Seinonella peptonophila TaxID=112248 RepID=A0A1M4Z621_9BACL|nr:ABC transporter ATP-binding protein [Seinonella peptonophila]SHF13435.1 ABC-2 type transport system ATP-binding protein [Seinonella peptonophila]